MDASRSDRYTTDDVIRATEPVVAPVTPAGTPIDERPVADRTVVDRPVATPAPAPTTTERVVGDRPYMDREQRVVAEERRGGFSVLDSFLGWNVAAFWMLVLTGIVLGILGATAYQAGTDTTGLTVPDLNNLAVGGIAGIVIAQFLAYFIGGYAAGRMARGSGVANGLGVAVWGVVIAVVLGVIAAALGTQYDLGYWLNYYGINLTGLTGPAWATLIGTLIAMFLGAVLGGMVGARPYDRYYAETREARGYYRRGRPL